MRQTRKEENREHERPQDNDDVPPSAAEPQAGEPDVPSPYPENSYAVEPSADVPPTKKSTQLNINCHLEKLTNLDRLPLTGYQVSCLPVNVKDASAGWCRAVAIITD